MSVVLLGAAAVGKYRAARSRWPKLRRALALRVEMGCCSERSMPRSEARQPRAPPVSGELTAAPRGGRWFREMYAFHSASTSLMPNNWRHNARRATNKGHALSINTIGSELTGHVRRHRIRNSVDPYLSISVTTRSAWLNGSRLGTELLTSVRCTGTL